MALVRSIPPLPCTPPAVADQPARPDAPLCSALLCASAPCSLPLDDRGTRKAMGRQSSQVERPAKRTHDGEEELPGEGKAEISQRDGSENVPEDAHGKRIGVRLHGNVLFRCRTRCESHRHGRSIRGPSNQPQASSDACSCIPLRCAAFPLAVWSVFVCPPLCVLCLPADVGRSSRGCRGAPPPIGLSGLPTQRQQHGPPRLTRICVWCTQTRTRKYHQAQIT